MPAAATAVLHRPSPLLMPAAAEVSEPACQQQQGRCHISRCFSRMKGKLAASPG
eukprot:CAMPEP_0197898910 /NCGR_PEP_ID=MMETSP1439-20131203/45182_1 /TAXON_ID=66791 /ORGANISM="Gonyaulax spinifera, Strain CCMP409" /LENGTH=53 /DNA_ID=CAMNT_0043519667 /DNA_START=21 /DNA_END=182 /DNA_ORIENTATION=-